MKKWNNVFGIPGKLGPPELVKKIQKSLRVIQSSETSSEKREQEVKHISKDLERVVNILYGSDGNEPSHEDISKLATEIYGHSLLTELIRNLNLLEFEARKVVSRIFRNMLIRQIGTRYPTVNHIAENKEIIFYLLNGYSQKDVTTVSCCGDMLRECMERETLTRILLGDERFFRIFDFIVLDSFDISSDAHRTFKTIMLKHRGLVSEFLQTNYEMFFAKYAALLNTTNYATLRQSLKLLSELLLGRDNFAVLQRYISDEQNLKEIMTLLTNESPNIKFESFHVFKCFVANPNKPYGVAKILFRNQDNLISFLENFDVDGRSEDETFQDERRFLIRSIRDLREPERPAARNDTPPSNAANETTPQTESCFDDGSFR